MNVLRYTTLWLALAAVVLLWVGSTAAAAVYHVAQGHLAASDGSPGTAEQPWKTISHAAQVLEAGDRVVVCPGGYAESAKALRSAGRAHCVRGGGGRGRGAEGGRRDHRLAARAR